MRLSLLAILSGALYVAALYLSHAWFLVFIALIPLIYAVRHAPSMRVAVGFGYLVGAIHAGAMTVWMLMVSDASSRPVFFAGAFVSWLLVIAVLGLSLAFWSVLVRKFWNARASTLVLLALAFVFLEYVRMHAFNILNYAPHIDNPAFFSPGFLGYPLTDGGAWLSLAAFGGLYLMSFTAIAANLFLSALLAKGKKRIAGALLLILSIVSFVPITFLLSGSPRASAPVRIGIMSIHTSSDVRGDRRTATYTADVERALTELTQAGAKVVVFPEGAPSIPDLSIPEGVTVVSTLPSFSREGGVSGKVGGFERVTGTMPVLIRTKRVLTPQGEYPIWLFRSILSLLGQAGLLDDFRRNAGYITGGDDGRALVLPGGTRASILFCIEMLYPGFGRALTHKEESTLIVAMLSHASFSYPPTLTKDTERALRVQAVEAGVPLVASNDFGVALAIDPYGRVMSRLGEERLSEWTVLDLALPEFLDNGFSVSPDPFR